ncbi:hypothetical protein GNY06_01655 [Elizabethkingia argentiflava]|uniref:Uncharacterized protein n=1 Tax=Elizabethkingia argenteiflava TaxID=2681556 RepID=A0A845PR70_9FLAO|nr:hypothetical protein [Elizabethkingia argenteiflava]NAW50145.1 hypothetical protein [Elizabethkingia argenteiflava]
MLCGVTSIFDKGNPYGDIEGNWILVMGTSESEALEKPIEALHEDFLDFYYRGISLLMINTNLVFG